MKNTIIVVLFGIFLISANLFNPISERSKEQIILNSTNFNYLKPIINSYYRAGYRIVSMTSQSVSQWKNTIRSVDSYLDGHENAEVIKGEIIVIMER